MDGIDVCLAETDGRKKFKVIDSLVSKYSKNTKVLLNKFDSNSHNLIDDFDFINDLEKHITVDHYKITKKIIDKSEIIPDVVGFHGQTIFHDPKISKSIQIGDAKLLKELLQIDIIHNFRKKDLELNGNGAPISPIYHKFLIESKKLKLPSCFVNIGGISNITYLNSNQLIGFDIGPGNCLIDKIVREKLGKDFDKEGKLAFKGTVNNKKLDILLEDYYFNLDFPKSLDKNYFNKYLQYFCEDKVEDTLATLSTFTIKSIERQLLSFRYLPKNCIITGGGVKNKFIYEGLKKIYQINFIPPKNLEINPETLEAEMICYLTARRMNNLPITFPSTTGVKKAITGGELLKYSDLNETT